MTPEQKSNIKYELQECSNILYFLSTSIVGLLESTVGISDSEQLGAQACLFNRHDRLKATIAEFDGEVTP